MSDELTTAFLNLPRQLPGPASRQRFNQALDQVDAVIAQVSGNLAALDGEMPRVKNHGPFLMAGGEVVVTLPEPYRMGIHCLDVVRGGVVHAEGVHWVEIDERTIAFVDPCEPNEIVTVREYQRGRDAGSLTPIAPGSITTVTETPSGVINSTDGADGNGVFQVSYEIATNTTPKVTIASIIDLVPNAHFVWSGRLITIFPGYKPIVGESITVEYAWSNT
jgi:hypothetical protein